MIFVSTTFFPNNTEIEKVLNECSKYSINNIELGSNHPYDSDYIKKIKRNNFNYLAHNYFLRPKNDFVINIASLDKEILDRSINHVFMSIDVCSDIGAKMYTIHPGFLTDAISESKSELNYDFIWDESRLNYINYEKCFETLLFSLEKILNYSNKKNVLVSIETEGSYNKKEHLLLQRPEEYEKLIDKLNSTNLKFNLNIGHLHLASNTFKFKPKDFVNVIENYICSFELSHNNGYEDQHLPLLDEGWYWDLILDKRFSNCYKILEFRNININSVLQNMSLFERKLNAIKYSSKN